MRARVYEQLARAEVVDGSFDASELVFSLEGMLLLEPSAATRPLLERAFFVIRRSQGLSPYWRPIRPFVSKPQGHVLFAISVETASSLLRCCALSNELFPGEDWFSKNARLFALYVEWLRVRHRKGACSDGAAASFRGWHSEHVHLHQGIHLWETSQVLLFLVFYASMLDRHIARESLAAANLSQSIPERSAKTRNEANYWPVEVSDPLAGLPPDSALRVFDNHAFQHFVSPRLAQGGGRQPAAHYSALLYGPPGTGKTSFAEELCKALNWPLVTITPSDFVYGGESQIEARAKLIFEVLREQRDVVILFDEIDRLILDRDSCATNSRETYQSMTPSMLTKIRELRKRERTIFLIATNYEERIDAAIKRKGRIDQACLIAPPDQAGRLAILAPLLKKYCAARSSSANNDALESLAVACRALRLMVYGELRQVFEQAASHDGPVDDSRTTSRNSCSVGAGHSTAQL